MRASQTAPGHRRLRVGACLSLSGRYARFGRQAARGLDAWRSLDGAADLIVADDRSDPRTLADALPGVAARCDVLLGPTTPRCRRPPARCWPSTVPDRRAGARVICSGMQHWRWI